MRAGLLFPLQINIAAYKALYFVLYHGIDKKGAMCNVYIANWQINVLESCHVRSKALT